MSTKHTPGPWVAKAKNGEHLSVVGPNGETVIDGCGCCGSPYMSDSNWQADALLIESAPDLLDALKELGFLAEREIADPEDVVEVQRAKAAIAKATGSAA